MGITKKSSRAHAADSRKGGAPTKDAIVLLKQDHSEVKAWFDQFESARSDAQKQKLAHLICEALKVHTTLEEEIFYPAAREALAAVDLIDEAEVEHASARELIAQIETNGPDDDKWDAKVKVLGEYVEHHVKEEEKELFPKIRKTELDLKALAEQLLARKSELVDAGI